MTYRITYHSSVGTREAAPRRPATEEYHTEHEAMRRARDLIDTGEHHAVLVSDSAGNTLAGVRLQLRLGFTGE